MSLVQFNLVKKIFPWLIIFICLLGITKLQNQQQQKLKQETQSNNYLTQEQAQKRLVKIQKYIPSFGFENLIADWSFLSFVDYFGDQPARNEIGHQLVADYFDTISDRDPRFTQAHLHLSVANTMYAGQPTATIAYMERVLAAVEPGMHTDTSLLWSAKGMDELLFLGDTKAAKYSYEMAAKWAKNQSDNFNQNRAIKNLETALFLSSKPDTKAAQIMAWSSVLPNIKDEQRRQEIIAKIERLKTELAIAEQNLTVNLSE